ncbi:thermonuclease precursor [Andreesenia angusta]|uniref:Thermonuclease n=1 Tax=Andreesenia angusta TaxID=39480 RepID=A0A1S1V4A1_9FIRM|nr:S-layer homology domain-containing protein [Andreesenia angusta]OHW61255.1 thermonuclease precursor [Andreesenia angusta]
MKLKQRILSMAIAGSTLISGISFAFNDIGNHWSKNYVESLSESNIISGYQDGSFRPNSYISREEAAKIVSNYIGGSEDVAVPSDSINRWSTPAIQNLIGKGIVKGYQDGTFKPERQISRSEFATLIYNALSRGEKLDSSIGVFGDVSNHWAKNAVQTLAGNRILKGSEDGTFKPDRNITRAEAATMIYMAENLSPVQNTFQEATVVSVTDGDTIKVSIAGVQYTVRMIGMDTPETVHPSKPVEPFGPEASAFTKSNLTGRKVYLQKDVSDTDRYGRLLRYVWTYRPSSNEPGVEEIRTGMFNAVLLINGFARVSTYPPDVKYSDLFTKLSRYAQNDYKGVWSNLKPVAPPMPGPGPSTPPTPEPAPSPAPSQGLIKGNISSSGEKIYHVPGGAYYDRTTIDTSKGERWFNTEAEAVAAGWRKSSK